MKCKYIKNKEFVRLPLTGLVSTESTKTKS